MKIEEINVKSLKPYENNPRINDASVDAVANSIKAFGFRVPVVVDKDNVIIAGHTRLKAALKLGLKSIPCIRADDLTPEQVKAFRIADNSAGEASQWDWDKLNIELEEISLDMGDFGLKIDLPEIETEPVDWAEKTQARVAGILNLGKAQYEGNGKYDIPEILPVYTLPPIREWIGFHYVPTDKDPEGKAVHFFENDYLFERLWNHPDDYLERLRKYVCVASPDFSPYGDMPLALQIYNHYRKHWVARWLQDHGVTVIPTIRGNTDPRCAEYFLDGEPRNSIVIMSAMWSSIYPEEARKEYQMMKDTLQPSKVFIYGKNSEGMGIAPTDNIEYVENFLETRWER